MPVLAFFFVLFALSSIGLPGLNGFVSEFLTVLGAFVSPHLGVTFGAWAATGIVLGAIYMLHMVARVIWGPLHVPAHEDLISASGQRPPQSVHQAPRNDLNGREIALLVPIALAVVLLGVLPSPVLNSLIEPLRALRQPNPAMRAAADPALAAPRIVQQPDKPVSPQRWLAHWRPTVEASVVQAVFGRPAPCRDVRLLSSGAGRAWFSPAD
jgi:NADH-quinone oxidoreductase subunit M